MNARAPQPAAVSPVDARGCASLGELLDDVTLTWKSEVALIEVSRHREVHRWTYLDVRREVARVAAWLADGRVGPGDRVAILMSNQSRWLVGAAAILRVGGVIVPLDPKLTAQEHGILLGLARPVLLVAEHGMARPLTFVGPRLLVDAPDGQETRWEALPDASMPPLAPRSRADDATLVYSSGTGGTPKGVRLSHGAYLAQLDALLALYPMVPGERFFSILPTNHAIDFMCGFLAPFACGATVVHQRTLRPELLRATMQRYAPTHMAAVPRILEALQTAIDDELDALPTWQRAAIDALADANDALTERRPRPAVSQRLLAPVLQGFGGRLRLVFAGGAYVRPELAASFYRLGVAVVVGYGLTEACTVVTVNDLRPFRADTVGRPVRGVDVRIVEPGGDGVGEVQVRGPTVMTGYDQAPELTADAFTPDGWLRTGDLGWLDASGHLHLVGRQRDMIVTPGGKNVYPEDVEGAFDGVGADEVAVFATDFLWPRTGALGQETLVAVVRGLDLEAVRSANRRLPEHKRLAGVVPWTDEFPRTASLKLKRGELASAVRAALPRDAVVTL